MPSADDDPSTDKKNVVDPPNSPLDPPLATVITA